MQQIDLKRPSSTASRLLGILLLIGSSVLIWEWLKTDQVFLLVLGLVLLLFYISTLASYHKLKYDKDSNKITLIKGLFLPYKYRKIDKKLIKKIELRSTSVDSKRGPYIDYQMYLLGEDEHLICTDTPLEVRRLGEETADMLRLSLTNKMFAKATTRRFSELNTPLIEQWKKKKTTPKKPRQTKDLKSIEVNQKDDYAVITIPAHFDIYKKVTIGLSVIAIVIVGALMFTKDFQLFYLGLFASTCLLVAYGLTVLLTRSAIKIGGNYISYGQGMLSLKEKIKINLIEEIVYHNNALVIIADHKYLHIKTVLDDNEFAFFSSIIEYYLYRFGKI
ncbi:hypothetical protein E1176_15880 [Fulvivirga sp. RKSG066]|uniref:hypothetical protein n=1 Tax=Fulvivirga aurantia TaxID=2529383 RepID=UPI0012BB81A9|nr:hypothetical protein [Fulvivirga aurantia]MTI22511.1 hypothetical protein [Fulvivirga aurantia]